MTILYLIIGLLLAVILGRNVTRIRGARGESKVSRILGKLDNSKHKVLNDLLIKTSRGTSQIDHVVLSPCGIFVIETKNYSGWIHGSEKSEFWTQSIYRKKYQFRNPIKQNWSHVFALKENLSGFGWVQYHPIVVFTGRSELKNVYTNMPVIYAEDLIRHITGSNEKEVLPRDKILAIERKLAEANNSDRTLRKEHIFSVKNRTRHREKLESLSVCPKCGGSLVVRKGKYGKFWECSNYPKCRQTQKI